MGLQSIPYPFGLWFVAEDVRFELTALSGNSLAKSLLSHLVYLPLDPLNADLPLLIRLGPHEAIHSSLTWAHERPQLSC